MITGYKFTIFDEESQLKNQSLFQESNPRAKSNAALISSSFDSDSFEIYAPTLSFDTVWMWSKLITLTVFMSACSFKMTSVGMSRIVDVMGAMVTSPRNFKAEFRVKITTGRFLSGDLGGGIE